jgi:hypothetical protein
MSKTKNNYEIPEMEVVAFEGDDLLISCSPAKGETEIVMSAIQEGQ